MTNDRPRHGKCRVRTTVGHCGSKLRNQHVYIRLTEKQRKAYNQILGGFKHFIGPRMTGAVLFEIYAIPAMREALKKVADAKRGE